MTVKCVTSEYSGGNVDLYITWCGTPVVGRQWGYLVWIHPELEPLPYLNEQYIGVNNSICLACLEQLPIRTLATLDI